MATPTILSVVGSARPDGKTAGTRKAGCKEKDESKPFFKCLETERNNNSQQDKTISLKPGTAKQENKKGEDLQVPGFVLLASVLPDQSTNSSQLQTGERDDADSSVSAGKWSLLPVNDGTTVSDQLAKLLGIETNQGIEGSANAEKPTLIPGQEELPPDFVRFLQGLMKKETGETTAVTTKTVETVNPENQVKATVVTRPDPEKVLAKSADNGVPVTGKPSNRTPLDGLTRKEVLEVLGGEGEKTGAKVQGLMNGKTDKPILSRAAQSLSNYKPGEEVLSAKVETREENGSRKLFLDSVNEINQARQELQAKQVQDAAPVKSTVDKAITLSELPQKVSRVMERFWKDPDKGESKVELRLDPPQLGRVKVSLTIEKGVLHSEFTCSGEASNQIRQNLHQLRADLAGQGITLGQTTVNDGSTNPNNNGEFNGNRNLAGGIVNPGDSKEEASTTAAVNESNSRLSYLI